MTNWNSTILSKSLGENGRPPRFPQLVIELKKRLNVIINHFHFRVQVEIARGTRRDRSRDRRRGR